MSLAFTPLHPDLGAEVAGVDLREPPDDATFAEILAAYYRYSVLAFRDQDLGPAEQAAFLRRFGTPKISQRKEFHVPGVPEIGRVGNTRNPDGSPAAFLDRHGNLWHNDTSSDEHIDGVTMLYCAQTPAVGGDTLFTSASKAWETLPAELKARIDGKTVVHNFNKHNDALLAKNPGSAKPLSPEDRAKWPDRRHQLVQRHPVTGRTLYFVTPTLVKTIGDESEEDSARLAEALVAHATRPGAVLRYTWRVGDLVLWENRSSLHSATPADYQGGERLMHRGYAYVQIGAGEPVR